MKHRINVSLALILSCVLAASPSLVLASGTSLRTAISRKMDRMRLPKPERLRLNKPVQAPAPEGQTSTLLPDGRVLVVGGIGAEGTAVINDPLTGERLPLPNLAEARAWHSATVLPDGRVLLSGGRLLANGPAVANAFIASLDQLDGTVDVVPTDRLSMPRAGHQATILCDGTVLISSGTPNQAAFERYNPPSAGRR